MTVSATEEANVFQNPKNFPLEDLKLTIKNNGVVQTISALDRYWADDRILSFYSPAPANEKTNTGALQTWIESMEWYINDLKWLLSLEYHKFWSQILHNPKCMDMLVSFLQDAYPPYLPMHENKIVMDLYNQAYKRVLIIFNRLITTKEAEDKWMSDSYFGQVIYEKFVFTIPIIWDLCLIYGTTNKDHISRLLEKVFYLQPKYYDDLGMAIEFLKQVFDFISIKTDKNSSKTLPEAFKGFSHNFGGRQTQTINTNNKLSLIMLQDFILHVLDSAVTMNIFLELHIQSRKLFREKEFHNNIVNFYENTVTKMFERAQELNETETSPTTKIYDQLNNLRVELIDAFHYIICSTIDDIFAGSNIEENINYYLTIITDSLSEKTFIKDYNSMYPIDADLDILCQRSKDMDSVKCDFILQAVHANYDENDTVANSRSNNHNKNNPEATASTAKVDVKNIPFRNGLESHTSTEKSVDNQNDIPKEAKTQSLISEVKDILPDLGDGFVLKCLEHYDFSTERVINCILEGNLDKSLQGLDTQLPIIPVDALDERFLKTGIERLNVFDNDEFDVMTRDNIDTSKIHKGKKKFKHKNLSDMLNDKTYIKEMKESYAKYGLVTEDTDMYDDEYDDTYDDAGRDLVSEATVEADKKPVLKSTLFKDTEECQAESEEESDEAEGSKFYGRLKPSDPSHFCVNPEEMRARYQARRDLKYGNKNVERDVVGKAKGRGQEKDVLLNRQNKNANKSVRGNHNRRSGAQWKRNQGLLPS